MHDDVDRIIITRWRLSSHSLYIETGRYKTPNVPHPERICMICDRIEDEEHAIFQCPVHTRVRKKHEKITLKYNKFHFRYNWIDRRSRGWPGNHDFSLAIEIYFSVF